MGTETLFTKRLILSLPKVSDATEVLAIAGDRRAVEYNPSDLLFDQHEATELLARWIQHWNKHGFGYWCVRLDSRDRLIGYCGIKKMTNHGRPVLNLIYRFSPEAWGNGYATEAGAAIVAWASQQLPGQTVIARVRPDNLTSQKVAHKLGLHRDPELDEQGKDGIDLAFSNRLGPVHPI